MTRSRWILVLVIAALAAAFFTFNLGHYFTLDYLKSQRDAIETYRSANPLLAVAVFFVVYVAVTALSLPGAAIMTLAAGAIFGLLWGTVIVSFASTIGATGAFLVTRYVLRDAVQSRYGDRLKTINAGIEKDGAFYLFTLRLVPAFPFFLINLLLGLTAMPARTFFWVSQIGMLAGTIVYVNAGTQLARLTSLKGILSPGLLGAFVLLGIFPLIARKIVDAFKARKVYMNHSKPKRFDRNLIVIGGGSAGLVTAYIAAAVKAKVTLIEKSDMGGDCLNTGCVPSKAILRTAKLLDNARRAQEFGVKSLRAEVDFAQVMERVKRVIAQVEPHDSVERYTGLGVDVIKGHAKLVDPWTVEVNGKKLTSRDIVNRRWRRTFRATHSGTEGVRLSHLRYSLGNPRATQAPGRARRRTDRLRDHASLCAARLPRHASGNAAAHPDPRGPEFSEIVRKRFVSEGVDVRVNTKAKSVVREGEQKFLVCEAGGKEARIPFDQILVAVGRAARLKGYGLEELGVKAGKTVEVNEFLQTNFPNIYACGDVAGPYQFTHTASHMAWYCAVNSLFAPLLPLRGGKFKVDYSVIPWATFTEPEVARVGLNELDAKEKKIPYEVTTFDLEELDRAIADSEAHGIVKVLTVPGKDKILGVTIAGEHAGDIIAEYVLAMRHGIGLNKILGTIHIYPTLAEMNKYAAGNWKRAHQPEGALRFLEKFHAWRRG